MRSRIVCGLFIGLAFFSAARALQSNQLAVIVNTQDPLSVQIAQYYAQERHILFQNIIKVRIAPGRTSLTREEFRLLKALVDQQTHPSVQAYALTWMAPYSVECMSITSALAFGFDPSLCAEGCQPTRRSPYFDSPARLPFTQLGLRPAMSIAASSLENAKALIDRGVASDGSSPRGSAYLLSTTDSARNVRSSLYPLSARVLAQGGIRTYQLRQDDLADKRDVLFYFTGRSRVEHLDTLQFLPGAIADHLTSSGGQLTDSEQMSALRWLEAGATASYGTVVEPCNLLTKFPHPAVAMRYYLRGETAIEAYWKSVMMPGQGIFIGEPLAAPFAKPAQTR